MARVRERVCRFLTGGLYDKADLVYRVPRCSRPGYRWTRHSPARIDVITLFGGPAPAGSAGRGDLVGRVLAESGRRAEAQAILSELKTRWSRGKANAFEVATVYVGLHDFDNAFAWIDKAIDDFSLRVDIMDPTFEELREDSRFAHVRERLRIAGR